MKCSRSFRAAVAVILIFVFSMSLITVVQADTQYVDCAYETLSGERGRLSNFERKLRVLLYGRIGGCPNTNGVLSFLDELSQSVPEEKVVFFGFDIDSPIETVQAFVQANLKGSVRICGGTSQYANDMWQHLRNSGNTQNSATLPILIVVDGAGNVRLTHQGVLGESAFLTLNALLEEACGEEAIEWTDLIPAYAHNQAKIAERPATAEGIGFHLDVAEFCYRSTHSQIVALAGEITKNAADDYERLRAIHDWVAQNIYYDYDYYTGVTASTNLDVLDVVNGRYTVCQGYASLTAGLCAAVGIPCRVISGYALGGGLTKEELEWNKTANHAWNEAYVDGRWVILDTTWDSGNQYNGGIFTEGAIRWDYFDPGFVAFSFNHQIFGCDDENWYKPQTPAAPSLAGGTRKIGLSWPADEQISSLRIWRSESEQGDYQLMDEIDPADSGWRKAWFEQETMEEEKTYFYRFQIGWTAADEEAGSMMMLYGELSQPMKVTVGATTGDVDDNGNIDASDALMALQHSVRLRVLSGVDFFCADVTGDDTVDASDALRILQYSVDLITQWA